MAALTTVVPASKRYPQRIGTRLEWEGAISMAASYTTGGDVLSPKLLGMNAIEGGLIGPKSGDVFEVIPQADGTAKIKAYTGALAEVASTTNLSAVAPFGRIVGH